MIPRAIETEILRLHQTEHWPIGTIAAQLRIHHGTVRRVLAQAGVPAAQASARPSIIDPYRAFTCVGTLVDRLVHRAEIVGLEGESYRLKEAVERTERKAKARKSTPRKPRSTP